MSKAPLNPQVELPELELLTFIVDRVNVGVFVLDAELKIGLWNSFMATHSGKNCEDVLGKKLDELFPDLPVQWFKKKVESVFILKNMAFTSWAQRPYLFKFPHNRPVTGGIEWMCQDLSFIPIKNSEGEVISVVVTLFDTTDVSIYKQAHEAAMERLEQVSQIDGLSQLYNRTSWESRLCEEVHRAKRYELPLSLIMLDLDNFKKINDTMGHLTGDEVIKEVSQLIRNTVRETDIPGRYGGEEFGIILPATGLTGAKILAERFRKIVESTPVEHEGRTVHFTISQGVAVYNSKIKTYEKLLQYADAALYRSKENGKNCWSVYGVDELK